MRHRRTVRKLSINTSHRKAMLANLAKALVENKKIKTTLARAKETRKVVERLISFAKKGTLAARRHTLSVIRSKEAVSTLFTEIAPQYKSREGGYTRIVKLGQRSGDGASLAYLELIGFEGVKKEKKKEKEETEKEKGKEEKPEKTEAVKAKGKGKARVKEANKEEPETKKTKKSTKK